MVKPDFNIYLKKMPFGSSLRIQNNRRKKFYSWSVKDEFNGESVIADINETIIGIYVVGTKVTLSVYDKKKQKTIINNVVIEEDIDI